MKPFIQNIAFEKSSTYRYEFFENHDYEYPCHIHPEYEILYFIKGSGIQMLGDDICDYGDGHITIVGPNLPHSWKGNFHKSGKRLEHTGILIQFKEEFAGPGFFSMNEMKKVKSFLDGAISGYNLTGEARTNTARMLKKIKDFPESGKIIGTLEILDYLAGSGGYTKCSSLGEMQLDMKETEIERFKFVQQYIMDNYLKEPDIKYLAAKCGMNLSAFCHFFRKRTLRTFTAFVTELRIKHACKLLIDTDLSVSQICYESGFNNLSNFNRKFKAYTNQTPFSYRKAMA